MQNNIVYGFKKLHHVFVGEPEGVEVTVHTNPESSAAVHRKTNLDFIRDRKSGKIHNMSINVRTSGNLHFIGLVKTNDKHLHHGVFRLEYNPLLDTIIGNVIKMNVFKNVQDARAYLSQHHSIGESLLKNINVTPQELYAISMRFTPTPYHASRRNVHPVSSRVDSMQVSHRGRSKPSRLSHKTGK